MVKEDHQRGETAHAIQLTNVNEAPRTHPLGVRNRLRDQIHASSVREDLRRGTGAFQKARSRRRAG